MQFNGVLIQTIGIFAHVFGRVVGKQRLLQTVEAGEVRIRRFLLVVVFTGVDAAVQIGEQLGDRLDALIVLAGRRVQLARLLHVAGLHRVGEQLGLFHQPVDFFDDVDFVFGDRANQIQRVRFAVGSAVGCRGDGQFAFRVAQQPAGHVVFARFQRGGHFLGEARRDVFALFHHHHPFQDFPFDVFLAGVMHHKLRLAGRHRQLHRFALLVVNRDLDLRHVRRQRVDTQRKRRDSQ